MESNLLAVVHPSYKNTRNPFTVGKRTLRKRENDVILCFLEATLGLMSTSLIKNRGERKLLL